MVWDASTQDLKYNGKKVVMRGFSLSSTEYILDAKGEIPFFTFYQNGAISDVLNTSIINAMIENLKSSDSSVISAVRIPVTAYYWLSHPQKQQYQGAITNLVRYLNQRNVFCIIDLHWNDYATKKQNMALKGGDADSLQFWDAISKASIFKGNPMVGFELYNEPNNIDYKTWKEGNDKYYGMMDLYNAIRKNSPNNLIFIAGDNCAYAKPSTTNPNDFDSVYFNCLMKDEPAMKNVVAVLHPFQGKGEGSEKSVSGFETLATKIQSEAKKPVIMTAFGQYCCGPDVCGSYQGQYNHKGMPYTQALLEASQKNNISWTAWAWVPKAADYNIPVINNGCKETTCTTDTLTGRENGGEGADYRAILPIYIDKAPEF